MTRAAGWKRTLETLPAVKEIASKTMVPSASTNPIGEKMDAVSHRYARSARLVRRLGVRLGLFAIGAVPTRDDGLRKLACPGYLCRLSRVAAGSSGVRCAPLASGGRVSRTDRTIVTCCNDLCSRPYVSTLRAWSTGLCRWGWPCVLLID